MLSTDDTNIPARTKGVPPDQDGMENAPNSSRNECSSLILFIFTPYLFSHPGSHKKQTLDQTLLQGTGLLATTTCQKKLKSAVRARCSYTKQLC